MLNTTSYYMLIASLPHMPRSFEQEQPPISRLRLRQRLSLLNEKDAQVVEQIQGFLRWDRQPAERTDAEVQHEYDHIMQTVGNPLVRDIVVFRMEVRTIMSALRRRRLGMGPPTAVGDVVNHITKNWEHPTFRLQLEHPWIAPAQQYLQERQVLQVQRQVLSATWDRWRKLRENYYFCFESLLLYLAQWEIIDRWARHNQETGQQRFQTLLTETLANHVPSKQ